jgi:flagellar hook-associated protein 2
MAEGILGLGSSGSSGLNQELIDKLKAAEAKAQVQPYEDDLEEWDLELEKIQEIEAKVMELLGHIEQFDLYNTGADAFEQVTASTTGSAAVFDAIDVAGLEPGTNSVTVSQLAQRDVYQTATFSDKDIQVAGGNDSGDKISVTIDGNTHDFSTEGKTYQELADEMNQTDGITASVEQVGDSSYRLVIKSTDSGIANALTIDTTGVDFGFGDVTSRSISDFTELMGAGRLSINGNMVIPDTEDMSYDQLITEINNYGGGGIYTATKIGDTIEIKADDGSAVTIAEDGDNGLNFTDKSHVVTAQNMKAQVDGVDYDVASNSITIQGNLTMTAVEIGTSTISIQRDTSSVLTGMQDFVATYNEVVDLIDGELYSAETPLEDLSTLRMVMGSIKDKIFGSYGDSGDKNLFNYGFQVDKTGHLSLDSEVFSSAIASNMEDVKSLFIGTAEKPGLGTQLKEYLDDLDSYDGILTQYGERMAERKTTLETEKADAQEALDTKYALMAEQFAAYTAIITQMEAAFGGMKMMIAQSTASN